MLMQLSDHPVKSFEEHLGIVGCEFHKLFESVGL